MRLQAAILLVAVDIGEARELPHLLEQSGSPFHQVVHIVALDGVLVLCVALPAADAQVLAGLQEDGGPRQETQFGTQTIDHLAGADFRSLSGLRPM